MFAAYIFYEGSLSQVQVRCNVLPHNVNENFVSDLIQSDQIRVSEAIMAVRVVHDTRQQMFILVA